MAPSSVSGDPQNPAFACAEAEALLGDVERAVPPDRHPRREDQARDNRLLRTIRTNLNDRAGPGGRPAGRRAHLERVELAAPERQTEDLLEPRGPQLELQVVAELPDALVRHRAVRRPEDAEVAYVEVR